MTERRRGLTAAGAIKAILAIQIAIAVILFSRDMATVMPRLSLAPAAPQLTSPVSPGDQRRRYDPRRVPVNPGLPDTGDMPSRLLFEDSGDMLQITGVIAPGDAMRFGDWLEAHDLPETVMLNSTGGSVADALDIGRTLRAAGVHTAVGVDAVCLSACPYILASGTERKVNSGGYIGVHQHFFGASELLPAFIAVEDIQRGQAEVVEYLSEMGIDLRLMRHSLATPPDEIYILTAQELIDYSLATEITE